MTMPAYNRGAIGKPLRRTDAPRQPDLLARFGRNAELSLSERELLWQGMQNATFLPAGTTIEDPTEHRFLLSGWLGEVARLSDGREQLLDVLLPGKLVPTARAGASSSRRYVALTNVEVSDAQRFRQQIESDPELYPRLRAAHTGFDDERKRRLIQQIVRLGSMNAVERLADLLLELCGRLELGPPAANKSYTIPLPQFTLGNLLGISVVHFNRALKQLRIERLVTFKQSQFRLLDVDRLSRLCQRTPDWKLD